MTTRVAGIDCGTNSIRLLVGDLPDDPAAPLIDVVREMTIVRLGEGVDRTGVLAPAAIERTRAALADFVRTIEETGATRVRMVATSATRDAANAADFRAMVLATLGAEPEVITGADEAALSFAGATVGVPASLEPPYLVVDIGGGSTEFVRGSTTVERSISVDVGCVRMTERHFADDPPTPAQVDAARADIAAAVQRALTAVDAGTAHTVVGLAGSVTTVAALALNLPAYDPAAIHHARISATDVAAITDRLLGLSAAQRLALPPMHPGRADVIAAGALILRTVLDTAGAGAVVASEHDILDGICLSLRGMSDPATPGMMVG